MRVRRSAPTVASKLRPVREGHVVVGITGVEIDTQVDDLRQGRRRSRWGHGRVHVKAETMNIVEFEYDTTGWRFEGAEVLVSDVGFVALTEI